MKSSNNNLTVSNNENYKKDNKFEHNEANSSENISKNKNNDMIENKINKLKDKYQLKGLIQGILIALLFWFSFNARFILNPLPNSKKVINKLNEMNYIIDKFNIYEKDEEYIQDMISLGMMAGLKDKYANYYTKEDVKKLNEETVGEYCGIGVVVLDKSDDGYIDVIKVYEGSPAAEVGIKVLDKIRVIDGKDVSTMTIDEVVSSVRGKANTNIKLGITRGNSNDIINFDVTRRYVDTPMITSEYRDDKILYVQIESFEGKAYDQICELKEKYKDDELKGIIIDLRNCPGGNLNVLLKLSDLFLDKATITYFEDKDGKRQYYKSEDGKWDIPMAIITNEFTASAAEVFTVAMKENGRAKVFGKTTYGKGVVQQIFGLSDGTAIKFTVSKYFTPNGEEVNGKGITPDVVVENTSETEDTQYDTAIQYILNY